MTIQVSEGPLHSAVSQLGSDAAAASKRGERGEQALKLKTRSKLDDPVKREALKVQTNPLFNTSSKDAEDPMLADSAHLQLLKAETQKFLEQVQREAAAAKKWNSEIPEDGAKSPEPGTTKHPVPSSILGTASQDLYSCVDQLAGLCLGLHGAVESLRAIILNGGVRLAQPQAAPSNPPPALRNGGYMQCGRAPSSPLSFGSAPASLHQAHPSNSMPYGSSPPESQCAAPSGASSPLRQPSPPRGAQWLRKASSISQPHPSVQHQPPVCRRSVTLNTSNLGPSPSMRQVQPGKSSCSSSRRSSVCKYESLGAGLRACASEADIGDARDLGAPSPMQQHWPDEPSPVQQRWLDVPSPMQQHWPDEPSPMQQHWPDEPSPMQQRWLDVPSPMQRRGPDAPSLMQQHWPDAPSPKHQRWFDVPSPMQHHWPDAPSPKQWQQQQQQQQHWQPEAVKSPGYGRSNPSTTAVVSEKIPGTAAQVARLRARLEDMRRERANSTPPPSTGAAGRPLPRKNKTSTSLYDRTTSHRRATYQGPDSDDDEAGAGAAPAVGVVCRPPPRRNMSSVSLYDREERSPKPGPNRRATCQGLDSDDEAGAGAGAEEQDPLGNLHAPHPRFTGVSPWAAADKRVSEKCKRPL
ncbi:hypothetical protein DUNSADRAFT_18532 [Dunaliella salina]|uniref:Uncharacterized protein n=1 Tax=Dunaliella salina TaxID=3046 RepID=A0ABQ7FZY8_DUNSA|nr:hypothetical protein DUNSADRAFT_18532 [Dunaliella salina]|eukprot:KAF5827916.1 hypothetical protein DUNSADRAFT_18532 [Dunaliella salina]